MEAFPPRRAILPGMRVVMNCLRIPLKRRASRVGCQDNRRRFGGRARIPAARARWHSCRTMTDCFRELDRRSNHRIDVRLLWRQRDDRVIVTVADGKTGKRFTVDVTEGESALDVFHHPFAYAA